MNRLALTVRKGEAYEGAGSTVWQFVMLSREQSRIILKRIVNGTRPGTTLAVWEAARSYAEWNTGQITASIQELAEASGAPAGEVYRALSQLVELGGLIRTGRGRYALNPDVAWTGTLVSREAASAELTPAE
jgi:hypothetical protein